MTVPARPATSTTTAAAAPSAAAAATPALVPAPARTGPRPGRPGSVVVVGGGLAGVAAALQLADAGWQVDLVEGRARLGGNAGSGMRAGMAVDTGQHVFLRCCSAYRGLLERLGVTAGTRLQQRLRVPVLLAAPGAVPRWCELGASGLPARLALAPALARYPALSLGQRLSAAWALLALGRLDPTDPAVDRRRLGDWLDAHHQGAAARAALFEVLTVATLNTPLAEASLGLAAQVVREGLLGEPGAGEIGWATRPLGELHDSAARVALAAAGVRLHTRTRVTALAPGLPPAADGLLPAHELRHAGGARQVDLGSADAERVGRGPHRVLLRDGELAADAVVVALPPDAMAALATGPAAALWPDGAAAASRLGRSPIVNVHVRYDRRVADLPPDAPFVATVGSPAQWVFDRTGPAGVTDGQYLAVSLSAAEEWLGQTAASLLETFTAELARLFPAARQASVLDAFVTREPEATVRQSAGSGALRPGTRTALPGVVRAGAWTDTGWPVTMEGAVRSGMAAATELIARSASPAGARAVGAAA